MLKLKAGIENIQFVFSEDPLVLEGKMNGERMISQIPMVHKLNVLSS